jgi:hypothetical protein
MMLDFMAHDFQIERITSTMCVPPQMRNHVHKNRPYHGLALHIGGNKVYNFVDRAPIPADKTGIIYMPQGSTYDVDILEESPCYAISFALSKSVDFPPFFFEVKNLHAFLSLFKEADDIWIRKPTGYQMKCKALLYSILFQMQKEYEEAAFALSVDEYAVAETDVGFYLIRRIKKDREYVMMNCYGSGSALFDSYQRYTFLSYLDEAEAELAFTPNEYGASLDLVSIEQKPFFDFAYLIHIVGVVMVCMIPVGLIVWWCVASVRADREELMKRKRRRG